MEKKKTLSSKDFEEALDIFSQHHKKCKCEDPHCAKCLSFNCADANCKVHTKQEKLKYKKRFRRNIESKISSLQSEGQNVNLRHPLRQQLAQLNLSIRELEDNKPVLNIDYRYGYGPNGSWFKRLYGNITMFGFIVIVLAIPALAIFGLYTLIKMLLSI